MGGGGGGEQPLASVFMNLNRCFGFLALYFCGCEEEIVKCGEKKVSFSSYKYSFKQSPSGIIFLLFCIP